MKRKLFKQIGTEWRTNMWLAIELLIVSVVMWYIVDFFYANISILIQPRGFNTEHCYRLSFNSVTDKSPSYIPDRTEEERCNDAAEILSRLQHMPFVEAAALSQNSYPYNGSNSGSSVSRDSLYNVTYLVRRLVTPDFVKVFRYEGLNGETCDELAEILKKGEFILGGNVFGRKDIAPKDLVGLDFCVDGDTVNLRRLGAAIRTVRYNDYMEWGNTLVSELPRDWYPWASEYCIRVKPDQDKDIESKLMDMSESLFHVGNKLLVNVTSFDRIRSNFQQSMSNQFRDMIFLMGFLLLNIFLGLFGTFWFRTQQRTAEIAIRMSMGASRGDIFRRLLSEGMILLLMVTPIAVGIDCLLAYNEFNTYFSEGYISLRRMAITCGSAFVLIALMIVGGIWIPASKARKIEPAEALKDE